MNRIIIGAALMLSLPVGGSTGNATWADEYQEFVQPILEQYCYDCHGYGGEEGGLALDGAMVEESGQRHREQWLAVWKNLRAQTMPPSTEDLPSAAERGRVANWIETTVFRLDPEHPDPGRVTVRRLNRREYRNTIHDLFDIEFDTDKYFPADDTGYGFDTVGDALTVSNYLLEEYLNAAEMIVSRLVVSAKPQIPTTKISAWQFRGDDVDPYELKFANPARVRFLHKAEHAGRFGFTVELFVRGSEEATENTAELVLYVNGEEKNRKLLGWDQTLIKIPLETELAAGDVEIEIALIPHDPPGEDESPLYASLQNVQVRGPLDGSQNRLQDEYYKIFFDGVPDSHPQNRTKYATKIFKHFGARAFRRPLAKGYLNRLLKLADVNQRANGQLLVNAFEQGITRGLIAILASPNFIYRAELQPNPDDPDHVVPLDEFALASRLSYLLWSSCPDDQLLQRAHQGELRRGISEEVDRMLDDWRSSRFFEDFVGQWLQTNSVWETDISERRVLRAEGRLEKDYDFGWKTRHAMIEETRQFVAHVFKHDRPLTELITADYTFLNKRLAKYYGVDARQTKFDGDELTRVSIPEGSPRGGLLTHGSFLLVTSNPTRTSPVKRGLFVLDNLLGTPAPPAPPDVPELEEGRRAQGKTMREQMEEHREDPLCASCHARMDPIGLALENFNAMGLWRDSQRDKPIDTAGRLMTGESFDSVAELKQILATSRKQDFVRCVTEKLLTYALGRGLEYYDMPTVDSITERMVDENGKVGTGKQLILEIVQSVPFQMRRGDGHPRVRRQGTDIP